jgi:LysM repeat protein
MPHRGIARIAASLALAASFVAVIVVVGQSGGSSHSHRRASSPGASSGGPGNRSVARRATRRPPAARRTYVVRDGDTLSTIATRTHVSLPVLQQLNPNVDPQGLHTGQRLKLK